MTSENTGRPAAARGGRRNRYLLAGFALFGIGAAAMTQHLFPATPAAANLPPPAPPAVTVSAPLRETLADWTEFTGQFSAVNDVELRAEVSGYLTEIHFTDGQIVHRGDLLFVIDPRPYQIQLAQAQAAVLAAQAQFIYATKETGRAGTLQISGAGTREQYDQYVEQQASARAALAQAEAAVASARLNLEFCHITAPFTGKISTHLVSVGNLVIGGAGAGTSTLLTTLISLDPIHLDFQMSEDDYLNYQRFLHAAAGQPVDDTVDAGLSDEPGFSRRGRLDFLDNQINGASGTIHARATFANPDLFITPGEFAQLRLPTSAPHPVLLLPDSALTADQSDEVAMTVAADGTVTPKIVQTGALRDGLREITSGLSPDDRVIIVGLLRAQPGMKVTPRAGSITAAQN